MGRKRKVMGMKGKELEGRKGMGSKGKDWEGRERNGKGKKSEGRVRKESGGGGVEGEATFQIKFQLYTR